MKNKIRKQETNAFENSEAGPERYLHSNTTEVEVYILPDPQKIEYFDKLAPTTAQKLLGAFIEKTKFRKAFYQKEQTYHYRDKLFHQLIGLAGLAITLLTTVTIAVFSMDSRALFIPGGTLFILPLAILPETLRRNS